MDDESGDTSLQCQLAILCHSVWYDPGFADRGFSLGRIVARIAPPDGNDFPILVSRLFAYAQLFGAVGERTVRVRLVRVVSSGYDEEEVFDLEPAGGRSEFGPWLVELLPEDDLFEAAFPLHNVAIPEPGLYEVRLYDGETTADEPIHTFRFHALRSVP